MAPFLPSTAEYKKDKSGFLYSVHGSTLSPIIMVLSGKWLQLFEKTTTLLKIDPLFAEENATDLGRQNDDLFFKNPFFPVKLLVSSFEKWVCVFSGSVVQKPGFGKCEMVVISAPNQQ